GGERALRRHPNLVRGELDRPGGTVVQWVLCRNVQQDRGVGGHEPEGIRPAPGLRPHEYTPSASRVRAVSVLLSRLSQVCRKTDRCETAARGALDSALAML